jgi:hypothetical protein
VKTTLIAPLAASWLCACSSTQTPLPQMADAQTSEPDAPASVVDATAIDDAPLAEASTSSCAPIVFPSGLAVATVEDATIAAAYAALDATSCDTPLCFVDVADLRAPDGTPINVHAMISAHFQLYELVASEIDPNRTGAVDLAHAYSTRVLVSPDLVAHLESLRIAYGAPVDLTSGFRSIGHQRALCQAICGADQCADATGTVTCARNSRHMWGAAADMGLPYESAANAAGFPYVFHENGGTAPHLHVDMQACTARP